MDVLDTAAKYDLRIKRLLERRNIDYPEAGIWIDTGWLPIVFKTIDKMLKAGWKGRLGQIKAKFGDLRICYSLGAHDQSDAIRAIVRVAEQACAKICERCGNGRRPYSDRGHISSVCARCRQKQRRRS